MPSNAADLARWTHTRLRRRLLYGQWEGDLRALMLRAVPRQRVDSWRLSDMSANTFRSAVSQVSVAYDRPPRVRHDVGGDELVTAVTEAGLWSLMQRVQRDTIGMREMLLHVDVVDGRPVYRPVYPDLVLAESPAGDPERPHRIQEARWRTRPDTGEGEWTWEDWDLRDPSKPRVTITTADGADRSGLYLVDSEGNPAPSGGLSGTRYGWRRSDGRPVLPYVMRHAERTGLLWDAWEGAELVQGTLVVALLWSFWGHVVRNASWPQRYGLNVRVSGAGAVGGPGSGPRDHVVTDPATVAFFESLEDAPPGAQAVLSQFAASGDPQAIASAIALYERRLAAYAGISPSDIQRVAGDPRSGYALAVSREGQREAQRRWEPQLRVADREALALTAILLNRATGSELPEDGYRVEYEAIPQTGQERREEREHLLALVEAGLLDRVSAYQQLHPGMSEADARAELIRIREVNQEFTPPSTGTTEDFDGEQ